MKKIALVSIKTLIFFVGWVICVSVIPIPDTASAVIWRFWAELIPLLFNMVISGNPILSGGSCKIEGSIIVLLMNLILMIGFIIAKKEKNRNL